MTTIAKPSDPTTGYTATYDAWNRLVKIVDGANTVAEYQYDGRNFRVINMTALLWLKTSMCDRR